MTIADYFEVPDDPDTYSPLGFPENIMYEIKASLTEYLPDSRFIKDGETEETIIPVPVIMRPLRFLDPERCVGIHAVDWTPDQQNSSFLGQEEPALHAYVLRIQNLIKHTDEVEGRALYITDAKMIRTILYRDAGLRVRLGDLDETILGTIERFKRLQVRGQRFLTNELSGQFVFLATTDIWVQTEITQT